MFAGSDRPAFIDGVCMAKRAKTASPAARIDRVTDLPASSSVTERISEFADDLTELLGKAREKAEGWIGQRQKVSAHLLEIRDTATELLSKLGGLATAPSATRSRTAARRRPRRAASQDTAAAVAPAPRTRLMSPEARKAISDAQKARWARHRRARKAGRQS
jgi:hypothetical protein